MVGPQPTGPPRSPRLPDAVRRHAPGVHRTAVMLTGDATRADRLVTEVFRHAAGVWGPDAPDPDAIGTRSLHDALLADLVRAYLRDATARHRGEPREPDEPEDWPAGPDAGDLLASLAPRERAATVLRHVEGWSSARVAAALHVKRGKVAYLLPPLAGGVRPALEGLADQRERPAQEVVARTLATLSGTGPSVVEPVRAPGRPWTWRWLVGAVALGLVVWVSALADTGGSEPAPPSDSDLGTTVALVDGTSLPTAGGDLTERGWVLDAAGRPPTDLEGLRLVEALPIDLRRATAPLRVDTEPRAGAAVFAVLWCDLPTLDANLRLPTARLGIGGDATTLPCAGTAGEPPVQRLVPLPPATGPGRTTALVSWSGDVPVRGRALLATYTEVGAGSPVGRGSATPEPVAEDGSVVLDGSSPAYQVDDLTVHHQRVRIGPGTTITAWTGAPGEITVQVDDAVVTDDGDTSPGTQGGAEGTCESEDGSGTAGPPPSAWRTADPELRDGRWVVYRPGQARSFELPERVRPADGEQREVTVAVRTSLDGGAWQVHVSDARTAQQDRTPLALVDTVAELGDDVPVWIGGHRLVAAWKVPNDGVPHPLVDPGLRPGRRFLLVGTPASTEQRAWGVVVPHVATTRGPAELAVVAEVADAFDETVWQRGDQLMRAGASTGSILAGSGTGILGATVPAAAGTTASSTLLAYEPVSYEDFDFTAAPPMGVSVGTGEAAAPPAGTAEPEAVVLGRFTREDLDEDGVLTIDTELTSRAWLRLTTEGKGRVQVLEGGRPAVWLADGWWTSWTAQPVVTEVRVVGTRGASTPSQPFELRVEGYAEGFAVEVLSRDVADGPPGAPETLGR